ncbi:MAG: sensor domain-containing diguanylate cyclase [Nevskia sp.]|nr:sensor domain-containing diguanylate cyclase [Nevskia sp.]
MEAPKVPLNEPMRLEALRRLDILDTASEESFDAIVDVARALADTPVAAFSIVDANRQWFKAIEGLGLKQSGRDVSFCGHVVFSESELIVPDALEDPRFVGNPLVAGDPGIRFYAGVPVRSPDGYCVGTLCVIDHKRRELSPPQLGGLHRLARLIERELALRTVSATDALTAVFNRGHFDIRLNEEWNRARRQGSSLAVLLMDVDYFKRYNDRLGHQAGDVALRLVAGAMKQAARRAGDVVARYGGEEFVAVLPNTDAESAAVVAEKIRAAVYGLALAHPARPDSLGIVTVSVGAAIASPARGGSDVELLHRADLALYRAKQEGRNRICCGAVR